MEAGRALRRPPGQESGEGLWEGRGCIREDVFRRWAHRTWWWVNFRGV